MVLSYLEKRIVLVTELLHLLRLLSMIDRYQYMCSWEEERGGHQISHRININGWY